MGLAQRQVTEVLVLKRMFKWASRPARKLLTENPATDWETPEPVAPLRPSYSVAEVAALENGVRPWLRPIVITLAWTGMRIEELVNLRWEDVDQKGRLLKVRVQEHWIPKGRRDRNVPLHPKVLKAILAQPRTKKESVFSGARGGKIKESYALACLKTDQERLGISQNDLHGFRRFFATRMMRAGVDPDTVRQWGGWTSLETMLRYLAELKATESTKIMDRAVQQLQLLEEPSENGVGSLVR